MLLLSNTKPDMTIYSCFDKITTTSHTHSGNEQAAIRSNDDQAAANIISEQNENQSQ
jgi:hypothetical protein